MITYNINWKEFPHMTFAHTAILPYHAIDFPGNEKSIELSYIEKGRCELYIGRQPLYFAGKRNAAAGQKKRNQSSRRCGACPSYCKSVWRL